MDTFLTLIDLTPHFDPVASVIMFMLGYLTLVVAIYGTLRDAGAWADR